MYMLVLAGNGYSDCFLGHFLHYFFLRQRESRIAGYISGYINHVYVEPALKSVWKKYGRSVLLAHLCYIDGLCRLVENYACVIPIPYTCELSMEDILYPRFRDGQVVYPEYWVTICADIKHYERWQLIRKSLSPVLVLTTRDSIISDKILSLVDCALIFKNAYKSHIRIVLDSIVDARDKEERFSEMFALLDSTNVLVIWPKTGAMTIMPINSPYSILFCA